LVGEGQNIKKLKDDLNFLNKLEGAKRKRLETTLKKHWDKVKADVAAMPILPVAAEKKAGELIKYIKTNLFDKL